MTVPFSPPRIGTPYLHSGARVIYQGDRGDDFLDIRDGRSGGPYQPRDPRTGAVQQTTIAWLRREHAERRLRPVGPTFVGKDGREREMAFLDSVASERKDAKSTWRFQWALAAKRDGPTRTDDGYAAFIARHCKVLKHERFAPPQPSTLRKLVRSLENEGAFQSVFVSRAGRARGQSQLPEVEDTLVHDVAQRFWATREWPFVLDAYTVLEGEWKALGGGSAEGTSAKAPSYETLRLRIRSLQTRSTVAFKYGEQRAARLYEGLGDAVPVEVPLQVAFMDGFELEQVVNFGDDLPTPATRMKCVALIEGFSTFVWPPEVFAGPYRAEQSVGALLNMMTPPTCWSEEQLDQHPGMAWTFFRSLTIVPDNDKTLIPPSHLPGLLTLVDEVALPETYDPNAKNRIESFGKWLKGRLRGLPGTVSGRRPRRDDRRDPVAEAELTMHQERRIVLDHVWEWNTTRREDLGHRSPLEILMAHMAANGGPEIDDPDHVERTLARAETMTLTTDGGLFDHIRYRNGPGSDVIGQLLEDNQRDFPVRSQLDGTAKITVQIRVYDRNLDYIDVLNDARGEWVRLWSTEPDYTQGLSRWEHHEYRRLAKERGERLDVPGTQAAARRRTLAQLEANLPNMAFRQRAGLAVFKDCEQVRFLSGARGVRGTPQLPRPEPGIADGAEPTRPGGRGSGPKPTRPPERLPGTGGAAGGSPLPRRNWNATIDEGDA